MHIELKSICVPTDFSPNAEHALRYGATLASAFKAKLHLLHVIQDILPTVPEPGLSMLPTDDIIRGLEEGAKEGLRTARELPFMADIDVVTAHRHGVPHLVICEYAKETEIDLLVLGTHGRTGLAHFLLGSVAERVVRTGPCPVLTVRHP